MNKYIFATAVSLSVFAFSPLAFAAIIVTPPPLPTTMDQCKDGGWQSYGDVFKNQGDCVSYVVTDGKNQPDGSAN